MKRGILWIVLFLIVISFVFSEITDDLSIISNINYQIQNNTTYNNFFKIKNNNYPDSTKINITSKYNITKYDENQTTIIFFEDYFNLTNINSYKTTGTGLYTFNETGNYTLCGIILNSTINDSNSSNDIICFEKNVIDGSITTCDITLNISSEDIFNDTMKFSFQINNDSFNYDITYYVTDLFENMLKETQITQNTNQKTFTPNDNLQAYVIRASLFPICNDSNLSNNNASKIIYLKHTDETSELEELDSESYIDVSDIYLGTDEKVTFGSTFRVGLSIYKGETTNNSISAYVQDNVGNKISKTTSFNLYDNYAISDFTVPILLESNCNGEFSDGEYDLIIEGIGAINSEIINISGKETSNCQTITKECTSSSKSSSKSSGTTISTCVPETPKKEEVIDKKEETIIFPKHIYANEKFEVSFNLTNNKNYTQKYTIYSYAYKGSKAYSESREANSMNISLGPYETNEIILDDKVLESGMFSYKIKIFREGIKTAKEITETIFVEGNKNKEKIVMIDNVLVKSVENNKAVLNVKVTGGDVISIESFYDTINKTISTKKTFDITVPIYLYENVLYVVLYDGESISDFMRFVVYDDLKENITKEESLVSYFKSTINEQKYSSQEKIVETSSTQDVKTNEITGQVVYKSPRIINKELSIYFLLFALVLVCVYFVLKK
jgi:hypothetical protein